ncbi:cell division protein FtsL [Neptunomonas japonica]|uniref:cell division protein FtsL n=1 Tax=Neptunomonas japonica TaxID=417574 RepID=UPI001F40B68F|nr:cell division protein FtsL [Neptunomonas japonica]
MFLLPAGLIRNKDVTTLPVLGLDAVARPVFIVSVLVILIVCSSLSVTYSAFQYRLLFNKQQVLVQQWDEFQVEWGQLLLEQSALGTNNRVEQVARKQLKMMTPQPAMIEIVQYER